MAREHDFRIFTAPTKELLLRLHKGSYDSYVAGRDVENTELTTLEDAVIMYEYSFQFEASGVHGLRLLGIEYDPDRRMGVSLVLFEALSKAVTAYANVSRATS